MRLAFVYGPFSVGNRPFDIPRLWDDPRGLTGSELSCFSYASELSRRGHEVTLFTIVKGGLSDSIGWNGVNVRHLGYFGRAIDASWDAVLSWNEPDMLRHLPAGPLRVVDQQLNDFSYCKPGFDEFVDIYLSPSPVHLAFIAPQTPSPEKWQVMSNGTMPASSYVGERVPGRVLWGSSPDRGLHWVLQQWPEIRRRVPEAHLRVGYHFGGLKGTLHIDRELVSGANPDLYELGQRGRYILECAKRLGSQGITMVGSMSRRQWEHECAQSVVLAYPCDTIRFTEGFSVSMMEACAAGVLPIGCGVDALQDIYGGAVPMVPPPVGDHIQEWTDLVVRALQDSAWREEAVGKTRALAQRFEWPVLAERLEELLRSEVAMKRAAA